MLNYKAKTFCESNLKQNQRTPSLRNQTVGRVNKEVGKHAKVGKNTVRKVQTILEKGSEDIKQKVRTRGISVSYASKILDKIYFLYTSNN